MTRTPPWMHRMKITSNVIHVIAYTVAVGMALVIEGPTVSTLTASAFATVGVGAALTLPPPDRRGLHRATLTLLLETVTFVAAIGLGGGPSSGFALLPLAAIFLAAIEGGLTAAGTTALAVIAGVTVLGTADGTPFSDVLRIAAVYALTAIAFSEVQRAMSIESERSAELLKATHAASTRGERLTATHDLLEDLATTATSPDVNAVATAHDALRDLGLILPAASARIVDAAGVYLARRGEGIDGEPDDRVPITWSRRTVAHVELWVDEPITPAQHAALVDTMAPVGVAIDNDRLLQRLAGMTIQRERVRLARELHDDIAPTLASVGLALDMALMSGTFDEEQSRNLEATRSTVTRLVDRIRARVQDLRADRSDSLVELTHSLVADVDADGPTVVVDIDERTPPRPAIASEIGAMLTEGFRNALAHADATVIEVEGRIIDTGGHLIIRDNGRGFKASSVPDAHFGLVGMRERATLIGATLDVVSGPDTGTTVTIRWSEDR